MFLAIVKSTCLEDTLITFHKLNIPTIHTVPYLIITTKKIITSAWCPN